MELVKVHGLHSDFLRGRVESMLDTLEVWIVFDGMSMYVGMIH
jgi:hypothetical protein